jgi:YVTN family beta-propeller protein
MKCFSMMLAALSVCSSVLLGTIDEWEALILSAPYGESGSVIPIGISSYAQGLTGDVGETPKAIAITPDGRTALVANQGSNSISVVDIETGSTTTPISLSSPSNIAITSDGTKAVVVGSSGSLYASVLDLTTSPISVSSSATPIFGTSLAITPNGRWALVGGTLDPGESISILDLTTNPVSFKTNIIPGVFNGGLAVTPDGSRAIVLTEEMDTATMIDLTAQPNPVQIHTVTVGSAPLDVAITPDGTRALVLYAGSGYLPTGGISVLNLTATPMAVQTLSVSCPEGFIPSGIAITPDGKKAVVIKSNVVAGRMPAVDGNDVLFFDLTTDPISLMSTPTIEIDTATAVAITPDQAPTARFTFTRKGSKVTFDASESTSPIGGIRHYHWKFGDGHRVTTTTPVVTHTYHHVYDKSVVVRLIVTNTAGTSTHVTFTGKTVSNNGGPSAVCKHRLQFHDRSLKRGLPYKDASIAPSVRLAMAQ